MSITHNGLHLIVYTSNYTGLPEQVDDDICSILDAAHRNNPAMGITGVMFFQQGRFLQFLEGTESQLNSLLQKIERDRRHSAIQFLFRDPIAYRGFSEWSMDFFNISRNEQLGSQQLETIRDCYRRNFVTCTNTLVAIYKGFIEEGASSLERTKA